jgi:CheY-like chemotaxis protein
VGKGTTFKLYLPLSGPTAGKPRQETAPPSKGGNEVILLAEDHNAYREVARHTLQSLGYSILEAGNGEQALTEFESHAGKIQMAILDVVMPGLGGPEVYKKISESRPGLPVIFVSGYSPESDELICNTLEHIAFLQKPYSPKALAEKVREVLDRMASRVTRV